MNQNDVAMVPIYRKQCLHLDQQDTDDSAKNVGLYRIYVLSLLKLRAMNTPVVDSQMDQMLCCVSPGTEAFNDPTHAVSFQSETIVSVGKAIPITTAKTPSIPIRAKTVHVTNSLPSLRLGTRRKRSLMSQEGCSMIPRGF